MSRKDYFVVILILGALSTISPFAIDMYLPGFPAIARDLNTSIAQVQLSLTSYLIGISAGQLLYGPLLDKYGRKTPLYVGLVVFVLASFGCTFSSSIESLIFMRFIQALGGCVGMVAAQALVRDLFPVNKTAQAFSLITLVIAVSPMIAPTLGGYVTVAFGWESVFLILGLITVLIMIAVHFILPEGSPPDRELSLKPKPVLKNFISVLKQPQFLIYCFAGGIATAAPFAYIAGSADVFINIYDLSEKQYGWVFALLAFAMIGTTQLNHFLLRKFKSEQIIQVTLLYQSFIGLVLVIGTLNGIFGLYALIALMFIFLTGQGLSSPNAAALSLAPFSKNAGSAAALLGSFRMAMGGVVSAVVSLLHNNTAIPMVSLMTFCALAGLIILWFGKSKVSFKAKRKKVVQERRLLA